MTVRVEPRADADLNDAIEWYAERGRGTAVGRLYAAWLDALDRIRTDPRAHPPAEDAPAGREVRLCLANRYGYIAVFELFPTEAVVLAFQRGQRSPAHWLSRLTPTEPTS